MSFPPLFFNTLPPMGSDIFYWIGFWTSEQHTKEDITITRSLELSPDVFLCKFMGNTIEIKTRKPTRMAEYPAKNYAPPVYGRE